MNGCILYLIPVGEANYGMITLHEQLHEHEHKFEENVLHGSVF